MTQKKVDLPDNYMPSDKEEYMSPLQIEYFRRKLIKWKEDLASDSLMTVNHLMEDNSKEPDLNVEASRETDRSLELRTRDRYRKLISKIKEALKRIEDGTYGFCEETGDPIGIKRLEARAIATLSIEAQERHERFEKSHNED